MDDLRIAVIGAGYFGRFHVDKLKAAPGARLVAVADADVARASLLAEGTGAQAIADPALLIGMADAVTIATPTVTHHALAQRFLDAGLHVFIEKPIAETVAQADDLIARAKAKGLVLQVGHQERVFVERLGLPGRFAGPLVIETEREGVFAGRAGDCNVVLDLMIHDIDIALRLTGQPVTAVTAWGERAETDYEDRAEARLTFADGSTARLFADRCSTRRHRMMSVAGANDAVKIDYLERAATLRDGTGLTPAPMPHGAPEGDNIAAELFGFIAAIKTKTPPPISGTDGRAALDLALRISAAFAAQ